MSDVVQDKSPPDRFERSGKGGGLDLPAAIRLAETVKTEPGAIKLYRMISRELDNNPLVDQDDYWNGYGALNYLMVNFPGVEDSVADPFPLNRHIRPKAKEHPHRESLEFHYHPKLVAIAVAIGLALFVVKPALDQPNPCPKGTSVENTSFQVLCVDSAGNSVKVLSNEMTP